MKYASKYGYKLQKDPGNVGYDICVPREIDLATGRTLEINTGLRVDCPDGYWMMLVPRSSVGKEGLVLSNTVGVIDPSFKGDKDEIILNVKNTSANTFRCNAGDAIAQLIFVPTVHFETEMVNDLKFNGDRGGSGSTGPRGSSTEAEVYED